VPGYDFELKIGMFRGMKSNNVALQLIRKRIAKTPANQQKIWFLQGLAANPSLFYCGNAKWPL
jgi:hypothetical protein